MCALHFVLCAFFDASNSRKRGFDSHPEKDGLQPRSKACTTSKTESKTCWEALEQIPNKALFFTPMMPTAACRKDFVSFSVGNFEDSFWNKAFSPGPLVNEATTANSI